MYLPEEWIDLVRSFSKVGQYKPALLFLSLLGLMAATLQLEYVHLHMPPIQWYLKHRWNHTTHGLRYMILINKDPNEVLQWWSLREHLSQGMFFSLPSASTTITTDASMEGWGGHCRLPGATMACYSALWSSSECRLHINMLGVRAVCLTLLHLEREIFGQSVLIESNNMATVSYINKQGSSGLQYPQRRGLRSVRVGNPQVTQASGDSPIRSQQRVGRLPVVQLPRPYRVAPQSADSTGEVGQAPGGLIRLSLEPPTSLLVLSDRSPNGGSLQCPFPVVDRGLSLYAFPPIPLLERTLIKIREDQAEVIIIAPN